MVGVGMGKTYRRVGATMTTLQKKKKIERAADKGSALVLSHQPRGSRSSPWAGWRDTKRG